MEEIINAMCKVFEIVSTIIRTEVFNQPVLPVTRYDTCVTTSDIIINTNNPQIYFSTLESVQIL
uniref:Uncharacterized protein n=1 Tax=viral metagenome TaxID=1070528 RepID=A0A6C0JM43_9ZZZZ